MVDPKFKKAYEALEIRLREAEQDYERVQGACQKCRWYSPGHFGLTLEKDFECLQPLLAQPKFNAVIDQVDNNFFVMKKSYRSDDTLKIPDLCGSNRDLFQPQLTLFEKFRAWLIGDPT